MTNHAMQDRSINDAISGIIEVILVRDFSFINGEIEFFFKGGEKLL